MRCKATWTAGQQQAVKLLRALLVCGLLPLVLLNSGCSIFSLSDSSNSDLGSPTYARGELRSVEHSSLGMVWKGAQGGARELGFTIVKSSKDSRTAQLEATGMSDRTIRIQLAKQGLRLTEISIFVGPNGDETIARLILSKIQQRL
jgi:hypothetical protein